jgi:hypothetical protein
MLKWIRALSARIKAMLAVDAVLEIQSEIALRNVERKANLLRLADKYETEGLLTVANDLRQEAESLDLSFRIGHIVPAVDLPDDVDSWTLPVPQTLNLADATVPATATVGNVPLNGARTSKPRSRGS